MTTPLIWILIPAVCALVLAFLKNWQKLIKALGFMVALILAITAFVLPNDLMLQLGPQTIEIQNSLSILGRTITIDAPLFSFIALLYISTSLWLLGSFWLPTNPWFVPIALVQPAILIAAMAVEPFLYAALLIEVFVLLSIPLLLPIRENNLHGVFRFLILQTIAMPLILISGWMLSGVETAPISSPLIVRTTLFLLFGFVLWLGVFPFHTWLPMLGETSDNWSLSLIVTLLFTTILIFYLSFVNRYAWLRTLPLIDNFLLIASMLMIIAGGLFLATQKNLGRAFGFAVMIETGFSLAAIYQSPQGGLEGMSMTFLPRILGFWLWSFSLSQLQQVKENLSFDDLKGIAYTHPFISAGILIGQLSIAGIPLLASFPARRIQWMAAAQGSFFDLSWSFLGVLSILTFSIRMVLTFFTLSATQPSQWQISEKRKVIIPISIMIAFLIFMGLFPHLFLPYWMKLTSLFTQLIPAP